MSALGASTLSRWIDAQRALLLYSIDPIALGGVSLRARPGPIRDAWMKLLSAALPMQSPLRKIPIHVQDSRLMGGIDLPATLATGRPVMQRGILAEADGGTIVLAMAERLSPGLACKIASAIDTGEIRLEREGLSRVHPTRFGVIALDEGIDEDERMPEALLDRLAFRIDLEGLGCDVLEDGQDELPLSVPEIEAARQRLPGIVCDDELIRMICEAASLLGVDSPRASLHALATARASAALSGESGPGESDVALAIRLVLAPRATRIPGNAEEREPEERESEDRPAPDQGEEEEVAPPPMDSELAQETETDATSEGAATALDRVLEAARSGLPARLLDRLQPFESVRSGGVRSATGKHGAARESGRRGRPMGVRPGEPRDGSRLSPLDTLRAAAPWQAIRAEQESTASVPTGPEISGGASRLRIRRSDLRVFRFREREETTTVFVVDASGSTALNRLAEAKGAVELLLAESYVRRDQVALIGFRGRSAELLLPPTRSLVRAKRELAALPGGGGTPLAAGIEAAMETAEQVRRSGNTPLVVFLTDGQANIARDGSPGRAGASADALVAARHFRALAVTCLLVDTSPRSRPAAQDIARSLGAGYLLLPHARSQSLVEAVRSVQTQKRVQSIPSERSAG